ncbi:hypothetical protein OG738_30075 [Amycolatopsis sp. NBC_01488]|uniref:hypothetical protein n=1 Tax=Amycolatopsis sp. NBC_01488 TaxID=2903563 RepID=UPI002E27D476|nr:hypothetical protein [Amycolatopsis sp. NBC_01488]
MPGGLEQIIETCSPPPAAPAALSEAIAKPGTQDPDEPATLVIDTLLHGAGPRG